ncbi:DUF3822 family protein [Algoriphagus taiwanensis]|uniref:DUF3822 family protein n=1 Tax=Algoriphagus taiwanensis TaxID=1445656 RepID=A0ABQ6Q375_9BACT|nr:hypothetical protein Ataiwa_29070 [Algoriphagus taiwanensis]
MKPDFKVYKSDRFDVEDTASLSLFLYPSSTFIFAKDKNGANIAIHQYPKLGWADLEKITPSDLLLKQDVPAKAYFHSNVFSLVPGLLFQNGKEEQYLNFVGDIKGEQHYFSCALDSNNLQLVSCLPQSIKKSLEARFSEVSFFHGACSFLSYLFKERFNLIGQEILINFIGNYFYLAAFKDQELSLFNRFEVEEKEDLLKYIFIAMEQLKFDKNHARISFFSLQEEEGMSKEWLEEYFHHVRIIKPHANQNYGNGFKNLKSEHLFEASWQMD